MIITSKQAVTLVLAGVFATGIAGCKKNDETGVGPAERIGAKIDNATSAAADKINQAAEKAGQGMTKAGENMKEAAKDAQTANQQKDAAKDPQKAQK